MTRRRWLEWRDANSSIDRLNTCALPRRRLVQGCAALLLASGTLPARAQADDPAVARIRTFYDALLATMKQADRLGVRGRYEALAGPIRQTYDLPAMTRIAVGPDWNSISLAEQTALIEQFSRMTIATYASRFDGYGGERFEIAPTAETRTTGRLVRTKIVQSKGEAVALDYLMRGSGSEWKVVDVYLTGTISELATRRAEFSAILKSGGAATLVKTLQQQADQQLQGSGAAIK